MNPVTYEQIMSLLGLIALWVFWYYLWKPQRVDIFRQKLFVLRTDLFDLAANGTVSFNHPAYAQLRLLINGLIRFAHRASFPSLVIAMAQSSNAPSGAMTVWKKNVQRLPEDEQKQLLAVYTAVSVAFAKHLIGGSLVLSAYVVLRVFYAIAKALILLLVGKGEMRRFTVSEARSKLDKETSHVARPGAEVIESRVLYEEQHRTSGKMQHAYAH
ncbi:MAG: hypothetical protein ABSB60_09865 [Terracidiphilus sp.]|jgi:hypothetical protein